VLNVTQSETSCPSQGRVAYEVTDMWSFPPLFN